MSFSATAAVRPTSSTDLRESCSSQPPTNSLFSSEEAKFITDSLSSAESFDPFTLGAPGFKMPNLLPPNLVASTINHQDQLQRSSSSSSSSSTSSSQQQQQQRSTQQHNNPSWLASSAVMSMPISTSAGLDSLAGPPGSFGDLRAIADSMRLKSANVLPSSSSSSLLQPPNPPAALSRLDLYSAPLSTHRPTSWQTYGHRSGLNSYTNQQPPLDSYAPNRPPPLSTLGGITATASGYGKNRAWQVEQLSFLDAQASVTHRSQQKSSDPNQASHLINSSSSSTGLASNASNRSSSPGLASLGLHYPSSHQFPANDSLSASQKQFLPHTHHPQQHQQQMHSHFSDQLDSLRYRAAGLSSEAEAMLSQDAGLSVVSTIGLTTPKARCPSSNVTSSATKRQRQSISTDRNDASGPFRSSDDASSSSATPVRPIAKGLVDSLEPTETTSSSRDRSPSVRCSTGPLKRTDSTSKQPRSKKQGKIALLRALTPLAQLEFNLDLAHQKLPPTLTEHYLPLSNEKQSQPHLDLLRRQHYEAGLLDESGNPLRNPDDDDKETEKEALKKQSHVLLTEAEKKANHIASEQKRRANIRKGYELLCEMVPSLKEALEREARKEKNDNSHGGSGTKDDDDEDEDEDDEDDDEGTDGDGNRRKKKKKKSKREVDGFTGCEIDGEKIDGRAGPRSEAVVLMKSLEHISASLEQYRALLGRRNRARLAVARVYGIDIAPDPCLDLDQQIVSHTLATQPAQQFSANYDTMMQDE